MSGAKAFVRRRGRQPFLGLRIPYLHRRKVLLPEPDKPAGGIRRYGETDVVRVRFMKSAQRLGFSLEEIGELLRLEDGIHCEEASSLAERKLNDVRAKLADLRRMEAVLSELVCACHARQGNVSCPLIASLQAGKVRQRA
ncbi:MerR family DNA-binding protein [Cupriavidus sp. Agwp_2]|uniref:MerR family DNA-binding protein n=1 Tax=Cupriavidus sp. Agwp_2 TaxID=2897324 RepID=UPI00345F1DF4